MTVSEAFEEFRQRLELDPGYDQLVQERHDAVRRFLEGRLPGVRTQLIGSLQRRTRIDPLRGLEDFDIDILVELGSFTHFDPLGGVTPAQAIQTVESALVGSATYQTMGPYEDEPAIVMPYQDKSSVELVPTYRDWVPAHTPMGRAYWVPRLGRWELADYDYDAGYISTINQSSKGRLIPVIKMLKAWRRHLVPGLRSYHLEVMAAAIVPGTLQFYEARYQAVSWPLLVHGFLVGATNEVTKPAQIPGSLSQPADYYLSDDDRQSIRHQINTCADWARVTFEETNSKAIEMWGRLFGPPFPGA
jgi:hypothetical protein